MKNRIIKNTSMLYLLNISKMIFPLITLPYLTRVLSVDCYGTVSYVKAVMQYMQLIVDFGFILSGTRDIVINKNDSKALSEETGDILAAKILLSGIAFIVLCGLIVFIPILRKKAIFTLLSFPPVFLTILLFDYLFRGLEKMEVITIRFVAMKGISSFLTFFFIHQDTDILWIPILDIIGSIVAIILVVREVRSLGIKIKFTSIHNILNKIKDSAIYFFSNIASTAFMALNTLIIGIFAPVSDVAYWSLCLQLCTAVQSLYTPLTDGIYPHMVQNKSMSVLKKALKIYMPLVIVGCILTYFIAEYVLLIIGGQDYVDAAPVLRALTPVLFFSFLSMLFGWPALGAIGKQKETTATTIITAIAQIIGLITLALVDQITLLHIAILRSITESLMASLRMGNCYRFRKLFN